MFRNQNVSWSIHFPDLEFQNFKPTAKYNSWKVDLPLSWTDLKVQEWGCKKSQWSHLNKPINKNLNTANKQ